jgi:Zn ribbon nucleic-acid-binding protein
VYKAKERKLAGAEIEQTVEQDTLAHWCAKVESILETTQYPFSLLLCLQKEESYSI